MVGNLIIAALLVGLILEHVRAESAEAAYKRLRDEKHKGVK